MNQRVTSARIRFPVRPARRAALAILTVPARPALTALARLVLLALVVSLVLPLGAAHAEEPSGGLYVGRMDSFQVVDPATGMSYTLAASLERLSEHAAFYVQKTRTVPATTLDVLASAFDETVYPRLTPILGPVPDPGIDGEHRVTVLLHSFGTLAVKGYFAPADMTPAAQPGEEPLRNGREMIYLNLEAALLEPGNAAGWMAHELAHLLAFAGDTLADPARTPEHEWLLEGLAMYAELAVGATGSESPALRSFAEQPGGNLTHFGRENRDYGEAFAFIAYLAERQGEEFLRELVAEPADGVLGVDRTLQKMGAFDTFAELFKDWVAASFLDGRPGARSPWAYAALDLALQPQMLTSPLPLTGQGKVNAYGANYLQLPAADPARPVRAVLDGEDRKPVKAALLSWDSAGLLAPAVTSLLLDPFTAGGSAETPLGYDHHVLVVWALGPEAEPAAYSYRYSVAVDPPGDVQFLDVGSDHPFFTFIDFLMSRGIISGFEIPSGSGLFEFRGQDHVLRAQFAKMVVQAAGLHTEEVADPAARTFPDVPSDGGPYPFDYVEEAAAAGIVTGFQDGTFLPWKEITRGQLVLMISRAAAAAGRPLPPYTGGPFFADVLPADPHYGAVMASWEAGILSGSQGPDGRWYFKLWDQATRNHVAKMTANLMERLAE